MATIKKLPAKKKESTAIEIINQGEQLWTTSLDIAEKFGKRHDNVIQAIENLDIPEEFKLLNFKELKHHILRGTRKYYMISRGGFSFLIMGFTGKKAAEWKIKYINAFEQMAEEIKRLRELLLRQSRQQAKLVWQQARIEGKRKRTDLTDAIKNLVAFALIQNPESKGADKYYTTITRMIYKISFNIKTAPKDFRDGLDEKALDYLQTIEWQSAQWINDYLGNCNDYHDTYPILKQKVQALIDLIGKMDISVLMLPEPPKQITMKGLNDE